jgi:hypothetical protein
VSFFDDTPERVPPRFDRPGDTDWTRPDGVIPGLAPAGLFLISTNEVAVAVSNALAYPNDFEFTVHALVHHERFVWGKSPLDPDADPRTRQARAELDSPVIHKAAGRAVILWPDEP